MTPPASECHCQDCNPTAWWMIICDLERKLAEARDALEDLVARDDWQEPFNGLDMSRARQALALINKTEPP